MADKSYEKLLNTTDLCENVRGHSDLQLPWIHQPTPPKETGLQDSLYNTIQCASNNYIFMSISFGKHSRILTQDPVSEKKIKKGNCV